jgi:hypothetical protein
MGFRWPAAAGAVAALVLIASCGGGGSSSTDRTSSNASAPTVSLAFHVRRGQVVCASASGSRPPAAGAGRGLHGAQRVVGADDADVDAG